MKTLKSLRPKRRMLTDFFVFDIETTPFKEGEQVTFIVGCIYSYNFSRVINSIEDFKNEFLKPEYKGKKVFAHNAEFDLSVLYENIFFLDPKPIFSGSRFVGATNGNCYFADSFNIYSYSARKLGEQLGLAKSFKKEDYETAFSKLTKTEIINGCMRDCEIVYDALYGYFDLVGDIRITEASLALTYFRRNFQFFDIEHNEVLGEYFRYSYFGGRTECFKIGKVDAIAYDINSMYPYAMLNVKFPNFRDLKMIKKVKPEHFTRRYLFTYEGCGYFRVRHKEHYLGFLPHKSETGKLCFPVGEFSGWWNFNEIRFAYEQGVIEFLEVETIVYAKPIDTIFKDYVEAAYTLKKEAKTAIEKQRGKGLMNKLYGKFGQSIDTETIYLEDIRTYQRAIHKVREAGLLVKITMFSMHRNDCYITVKGNIKNELDFCIMPIPSYITSFSRVYLLKFLLKYQEYDPVYCDTDSIFFNQDPPIVDDNELGGWKRENKNIIDIKAPKNYTYDAQNNDMAGYWLRNHRIKGVPKRAEEIAPDTYEFLTIPKTKESLSRQIPTTTQIRKSKKISGIYDKRIVEKDGSTKPITL